MLQLQMTCSSRSHCLRCQKTFLTIVEVANGGAVLATGGVVDLPSIPPRLCRDGLLCGGPGIHRVSGWTLTTAEKEETIRDEMFVSPEPQRQTYTSASAFWTGFQDNVTVLLNDGGLWKRSWIGHRNDSWVSKQIDVCVCARRTPPHLNEHVDIVCDLQSDHFNLVLLPKEMNILNRVSHEATCSSAETLPHPSLERPPSSPAERRAAVWCKLADL